MKSHWRVYAAFAVFALLADLHVAANEPCRIVSYKQATGSLELDRSVHRTPLKIAARTYERGLGVHALSEIEIALGPDCREFRAEVGVDNSPRAARGAVVFRVLADGQLRFQSRTIRRGDEPVPLKVEISNTKTLKLIADFPGSNPRDCMADWADARIVMSDGSEQVLSEIFRRQGLPERQSPYLGFGPTPEPETRMLSQAESAEVLEEDWLFQADDRPTHERIRDEIRWTRELASRISERPGAPDLSEELTELDSLAGRLPPLPVEPVDGPLLPELIHRWTFNTRKTSSKEQDADDGRRADANTGRLVEGVHGEGLRLSGDMLNTGHELRPFAHQPYTISAWIKTSKQDADVIGSGVGKGHVLLMVFRGVLRGHQWTDSSSNVVDGKTNIADGCWHHVAQVVDEEHMRLYVDGCLDASRPMRGKRVVAQDPFAIGARSLTKAGSRFRGDIDELNVFGRALSAEELLHLYQAAPDRVKGTVVEKVDADLYLAVRRVKRRIMFRDPTIDFSQVLLIDVPFAGKNGIVQHETNHRNGYYNRDEGGRLLRLDGLHPGAPVTKLAMPKPGTFLRPDLSYDATRVLFSFKPGTEKVFHLYEVGIDGSGLRQLTFGEYDDLDPIYMPAGHITFVTARCNTYPRCASPWYSSVLARCDADGRNIYFISAGSEPDYTPAVMGDGRILYTRWEYTDKAVMRVQSLWTVNPDGTQTTVFWGNQSHWPDMLVEARPIPDSGRVMFAGLGHHDVYRGSIGIIDQRAGFNYPDGLTKVTPDVPWAEVGDGPAERSERGDYHRSGRFAAYKSPYPLSEELFLVSARRGDAERQTRSDSEAGYFQLYLMDVYGNRELIYQGAYNALYAMPIRSRPVPPVIADTVDWPGSESEGRPVSPGMFYSADVYHGAPQILRGKAHYLRVLAIDPITYSMGFRAQSPDHKGVMPHCHGSPSTSITQSDGIKRILGTVPIAEDGSVYFEVPPCKSMHFQLLDEQYRALHTMRSFTNVMPGERRGCLGCHEMHSAAPPVTPGIVLGQPVKLTPPPWGSETSISYDRFVQPVLNQYCGKCHQGGGEGRKQLDLTRRPGKGNYCEPYLTLVLGPGADLTGAYVGNAKGGIAGTIIPTSMSRDEMYQTVPPMTKLSYASPLIQIASSGQHHDVKMDPLSLRKLTAWVDALSPYLGAEEVYAMPDTDPAGYTHMPYPPRIQTAPKVNRVYCQDEFPSQSSRLPSVRKQDRGKD